MTTSRLASCLSIIISLAGCGRASHTDPSAADVVVVALPELEAPPPPRKNMAWIPAGAFVAGTPLDVLPRAADEEMPGVQVVLHGFYIDQYPWPNEPGAIQTTNVTREEARTRCEEVGKRLCTELEWERACKGPRSTVYEYGDTYRKDDCGVTASTALVPTGTRVPCRSAFDVFDLHGGAFEWTASAWGRGTTDPRLVALRGGSGEPGDVFARCANAVARRDDARQPNIGFRCCAGDPNDAQVSLDVARAAEPFKPVQGTPELVARLQASLPPDLAAQVPLSGSGAWQFDKLWAWSPIGNEFLTVASGCAHPSVHAVCGIVIARVRDDAVDPLAFVSSGWWAPNVQADADARILWVYGGDGQGKYRVRVAYLWGRVGVAEPERGALSQSRRKHKR